MSEEHGMRCAHSRVLTCSGLRKRLWRLLRSGLPRAREVGVEGIWGGCGDERREDVISQLPYINVKWDATVRNYQQELQGKVCLQVVRMV